MFCENCGTQLAEGNAFCQSCGTAAGQAQTAPPQAAVNQPDSGQVYAAQGQAVAADIAGKAKVASRDAWQAIQLFAINPIGGLEPAYRNLDTQRVWGVVGVITVINVLCLWFVAQKLTSQLQDLSGILAPLASVESQPPNFLSTIIYGLVGVAAFAGIIALVRLLFRGKGNFNGDCFVATATLLPASVAAAASMLLGFGNIEIILALFTFAICYIVLILFAGYTRIAKIADGMAAVAVPIVFLVALYAMKVLLAAQLRL